MLTKIFSLFDEKKVYYNVGIYLAAIRNEADFDPQIYRKMLGGDESVSFRDFQFLHEKVKSKGIELLCPTKDGVVVGGYEYLAIALYRKLNDVETVEKPKYPHNVDFGENWLKKTFTEEEQKAVKAYYEDLMNRISFKIILGGKETNLGFPIDERGIPYQIDGDTPLNQEQKEIVAEKIKPLLKKIRKDK